MKFESILKKKYKIDPSEYMSRARKRADGLGYTGELKFADDGVHKMEYGGEKFGNVCCRDFIIYSLTSTPEKAEQKKKSYHARMFAASANRVITPKMKKTKILW